MPATTITSEELLRVLLSAHASEQEREKAFCELIEHQITSEQLAVCASILRDHMVPVPLSGHPIDTCGTGGSGLRTINTSTMVAFIVAASGGTVAKHGNRSASGNCGSFDVLETLDVPISLSPEQEKEIFNELGIVFLFAPLHHPALRHVAPLRKKHGKKTVFNLLGPLCNPARVRSQVIGTGNTEDAELLAGALRLLASRSVVVTGHDGLDEVTVTGVSTIRSVMDQEIESVLFDPASLGIPYAAQHDITGSSAEVNAEIFIDVLRGKGSEHHRNLVLVNAAHAFVVAGLSETAMEGFTHAKDTLASGAAGKLFTKYSSAANDIAA